MSGPGAPAYNAPAPPAAPGPPGDAVTALLVEAAARVGRPALQRDARLDRVCQALAPVLPDDRHTPFELVEFALQHAGIVEPAPRLILANVTPAGAAAFAADLRRRLPSLLAHGRFRRFGVGAMRRANGLRLVVALQESFISIRPFPRALQPPATRGFRILARIDPSFTGARAYVTRPDGSVKELELEREAGGDVAIDFACAGIGRHQLEITADERLGATVLANFPVYCGEDPPRRAVAPAGEDVPVHDARDAEKQLFALLNLERLQHNLPVLEWHEGLAALARAHSRDMAQHDYVGHVSPRMGDAAQRVRRARIEAGFLLENVARAYSAGEAHRGLMASPAHRRNLLSARVTLVGIGVVLGREVAGRREIYVTALMIGLPRKLHPREEVFTVM
ncbi:MAG: CAP domain-containing protein [Deltaproteobacteria bacterium]|nr:CAP domain-containing protein [Deltaproteobacteria bacterium]